MVEKKSDLDASLERERNSSDRQFGGQIIYISGGGLGLTLTTLDKLLISTPETYQCYIYFSLLFYASSLIANLFYHFFTIQAIDFPKYFEVFYISSRVLEALSLVFLVVAVILTVIYTYNIIL